MPRFEASRNGSSRRERELTAYLSERPPSSRGVSPARCIRGGPLGATAPSPTCGATSRRHLIAVDGLHTAPDGVHRRHRTPRSRASAPTRTTCRRTMTSPSAVPSARRNCDVPPNRQRESKHKPAVLGESRCAAQGRNTKATSAKCTARSIRRTARQPRSGPHDQGAPVQTAPRDTAHQPNRSWSGTDLRRRA